MTLNDISNDDLNKLKYGWSKYGGSNLGLVKDRIDDEWYCTCCGLKQPKGIPTYLIEFAPKDYLRICPVCENKRIQINTTDFFVLKQACT